MGDRHPLGDTGGTRGVNHVGDVVGGRRRQFGAGLGVHGRIVDIDDHQIGPIQPRPQVRRGDGGDRRGIGEHELHPRRGHRRVDRQIRRPGLEHRQNRDDSLELIAATAAPHTVTRAGALTGQQVRQPVRGLIQLAGRSATRPSQVSATASGARATCAANNCRNRHGCADRLGQHRPVGPLIQSGVLTCIQHIDRRHPPCRGQRSCTPAPAATAATSVSMLAASNTSVSNSTRRPSS